MQRHLFGDEDLHRAVERHWHHYGECLSIDWSADETDEALACEVAPILQEILGGADDGDLVWSGFDFDLTGFIAEPGIEIEQIAIESMIAGLGRMPGVTIRGCVQSLPFVLRLYQSPTSSDPQESLHFRKLRVIPFKEKRR
jgi:hypothetical protein